MRRTMTRSQFAITAPFRVNELTFGEYPDGTFYAKSGSQLPSVVSCLTVRSSRVEDVMKALFFADAYYYRTQQRISELYIPFIPGGRQDRLTEGDYLFTLKSLANEINARQFGLVSTIDPHSNVTAALIDHVEVTTASQVFERYFNPEDCFYHGVIAPDAGAYKRAEEVADFLGVQLIQAWKSRDPETGVLSHFGVEWTELKELGHYLVVDDICDGGGTFIGLAETIQDELEDVTLDLFVTHGVFSKGLDDILSHYNKIYTTDSLPQEEWITDDYSGTLQVLEL